jgi:hypothetical protein
MEDLQQAIKTVTMMSPPMLIIVVAAIVNIILGKFLPERYLMPIATIGGGAVAPYMFDPGSLAYPVPSPSTALVLIGSVMGFIGSVLHRRIDRWLRRRFNGHDTSLLKREEVEPSNEPPGRQVPVDGPPGGA